MRNLQPNTTPDSKPVMAGPDHAGLKNAQQAAEQSHKALVKKIQQSSRKAGRERNK